MGELEMQLPPAPGKTAIDYGVAVAQAAALAFPFLGPGITLFDLVTAPARGKRMSDWCEELRLRLNELSQKVSGLTPEALAANEAFISAFAQATTAAIKTHQAEKLEALRNAVLNVAAKTAPADDVRMALLALIDRLTPSHIALLRFFHTTQWYGVHAGVVLTQAVPFVKSETRILSSADDDFVAMLIRDLYSLGLTRFNPDSFSEQIAGPGKWLTTVGHQFLQFISEPRLPGPNK